jgi:hypothetical protein
MLGRWQYAARAATLVAVMAFVLPSQAFPCCCELKRAGEPAGVEKPAAPARPACCQAVTNSPADRDSKNTPAHSESKPGCGGCDTACCCGKPPCETEDLSDLAFLHLAERETAVFAGDGSPVAPALDGLLRPPRN